MPITGRYDPPPQGVYCNHSDSVRVARGSYRSPGEYQTPLENDTEVTPPAHVKYFSQLFRPVASPEAPPAHCLRTH